MFKRKGKSSLLTTLMGFFGANRTAEKRQPSGNRSLPPHMQEEIRAKAQAKRKRKMARPQGWHND